MPLVKIRSLRLSDGAKPQASAAGLRELTPGAQRPRGRLKKYLIPPWNPWNDKRFGYKKRTRILRLVFRGFTLLGC